MHVERPSILCFYLLLNLTLVTSISNAQRPTDPPATARLLESMENYVRGRLGVDSRLYNGREYIRNGTPAKGFPNFEWDSLQPGFLNYDGISYDISLEYDIAQGQLVIRDSADNLLISLVSEKTSNFSIGPYHFRYFAPGIAHLPEPGFYQELFAAGQVTLLALRRKNLVIPSTFDAQAQYIQINAFFLLLNGTSYNMNSEKELLTVLKDKKEELKKYIGNNHLSFKRHIESSLIQAIAYYQQIKP